MNLIKNYYNISDFKNRIEILENIISKRENIILSNVKISFQNNKIKLEKKFSKEFLKKIQKNINHLTTFGKFLKKEIYLSKVNEILIYVYLEEIINKIIKSNQQSLNTFKERNILITNKSSYEFPRDIYTLKNLKIRKEINKLNLPLIELPKNKDNENILKFLIELNRIKDSLSLKKFDFNLRIRKTLQYKKEGMFIVNANTIIIDPRKSNSIYHELGHYIYENKLSFTLNNKRIFSSTFKNIVKQYSNNITNDMLNQYKIEDYSYDSEVFAYWFETNFSC